MLSPLSPPSCWPTSARPATNTQPPHDRYLAGKKGRQACIEALRWLRGIPADHPYMLAEVHAIFQQIDAEASITEGNGLRAQLVEVAKPTNLKRLYIGCLMFTLMQMAGSNAINYYSPAIFQSIGLAGSDTSFFATGIYGLVRFVAIIFAMIFVVDRFGRTRTLMVGSCVMVSDYPPSPFPRDYLLCPGFLPSPRR